MFMTNTLPKADYTVAANLRQFVGRIAESMATTTPGAVLADFGDDNFDRPPAIDIGYQGHPSTWRPRIYFRLDRRAAKLEINVAWPICENDGGYGRPFDRELVGVTTEINVSAAKKPEQIANEIARRLLPSYLKLHRELQDRITAHRETCVISANIATRLAGGAVNTVGDAYTFAIGLGAEYSHNPLGNAWGDVTVRHGEVSIELRSLTEAQAATVLAALGVTL